MNDDDMDECLILGDSGTEEQAVDSITNCLPIITTAFDENKKVGGLVVGHRILKL